jgi:anti-anti-sigma factor
MDRRRSAEVPGAVYRDKQLVVILSEPPTRLRFEGTIDAFNAGEVEKVLAEALNDHSTRDVHLDLTRLEFSDVSGIRAVVEAAAKADGHRLVLHGLPPLMSKVMEVVGWVDMPTLFIEEAPLEA